MKLCVLNAQGDVKFQATHSEVLTSVYGGVYEEGDVIELTDIATDFVRVSLDGYMAESVVYAPDRILTFKVPMGMERWAYHYLAFEGDQHDFRVECIEDIQVLGRRNLAMCSLDQKDNQLFFPHAWANHVTRDEYFFEARNAIDGITDNTGHGPYPFQSWAGGHRDDLEFTLEFGRQVKIDTLKFYLRNDDIGDHDEPWESAQVVFSEGQSFDVTFEKGKFVHTMSLEDLVTRRIILKGLKKQAHKAYSALTQLEAYGWE